MSQKFNTYLRLKGSTQTNSENSFYKIASPTEFQLLVPPNNREPYTFTDIYYEQYNDIGEHIGKTCSESLAVGSNSCVFTFGASKSGKSFTLFGDSAQRGIRTSISYSITQNLFEYMKWAPKEKTCSITASFVEIDNEKVRDLGLAFYRKDELRLNQVLDIVAAQDLEIKEAAGKGYVQDACIIQISSLNDLVETVTLGIKLKEMIRSAGHLILCINFSTRVKLDVKSARVYLVEYQGVGNMMNPDFQKVLNKVYMNTLSIPVKSIPFKSTKLTLLLQCALSKGNSFLIFNIETDPSRFVESRTTLSTMKTLTNIDKKIKLNYLPGMGQTSKMVDWVKRLQDEVQDLEFSIQKSQDLHAEKIKNFSKLLGIEEDIDALILGEKGSREYEFCKKFRESLQTVNNLISRNQELDKKSEKLKTVLNDMRAQQNSNYEKNRKHLSALKTEVLKAKNRLVEFEEKKYDYLAEKLMSSTEMLEKELLTSHYNLEEKSTFLQGITRNMETNTSDLRSVVDIKELGKAEIENEFKTKLMDNDYAYKQNLRSLEDHFVKEMREKEKVIMDESNKCRVVIRDIDEKIASLKEEAINLFLLLKAQGKAIHDISKGHFNQGISPVLIPQSHIPAIPVESKYPILFSSLNSASFLQSYHKAKSSSIHSSSSLFRTQRQSLTQSSQQSARFHNTNSNLNFNLNSNSNSNSSIKLFKPFNSLTAFNTKKSPQSQILNTETSITALMSSPVQSATLTEIRALGNGLQGIIKKNIDSFNQTYERIAEVKRQMQELQGTVGELKKEKDGFREKYEKVLRERIDRAGVFSERVAGKVFVVENFKDFRLGTGSRGIKTSVSGERFPGFRSTPNGKVDNFKRVGTAQLLIKSSINR